MAEWLVLFTPQNKPWGVIKRDGKGLTRERLPQELREHVEARFGPFDTGIYAWQFQGIRGEYIDWPAAVGGEKRAFDFEM